MIEPENEYAADLLDLTANRARRPAYASRELLVELRHRHFTGSQIGVNVQGLSTEAQDFRDIINKALAHEPASVRALVDKLSPVIERRVAFTLWQRISRRDVRQEVKDMTQAVFLSLFEDDGKALRAWDPDRGSPLESFVSLLAHRPGDLDPPSWADIALAG